MRANSLDINNIDNLDDRFYGFGGGTIYPHKSLKRFSGADGVDWNQLAQQSALITQQLINSNKKSELDKKIKSVCGIKPLININGSRTKWENCKNKVIADNENKNVPHFQQTYTSPPPPYVPKKPDNILGMPKGLAIGLGIVAVSAIIVGGIIFYKKVFNKEIKNK